MGIGIVFLIAVFASGFVFYPAIVHQMPSYKDAKSKCENIKVGMSYDEVKSKYGNLFAPTPSSYVDDQGNGQTWINTGTKLLDASCYVIFKNNKVDSTTFLDTWL